MKRLNHEDGDEEGRGGACCLATISLFPALQWYMLTGENLKMAEISPEGVVVGGGVGVMELSV